MIHDGIRDAMEGADLWGDIIQKYRQEVYWFVFFDIDVELIDYVLKYFRVYKQKNKLANIGIIYTQSEWSVKWKDYSQYFEYEIHMSSQDVENLIRYYELKEFTDRIVFVSLNRPYGRKLDCLLELGITKENAVLKGIMKLSDEDIENVEHHQCF